MEEEDIGKEKRNIAKLCKKRNILEIFIRQITYLQTFLEKKITKKQLQVKPCKHSNKFELLFFQLFFFEKHLVNFSIKQTCYMNSTSCIDLLSVMNIKLNKNYFFTSYNFKGLIFITKFKNTRYMKVHSTNQE